MKEPQRRAGRSGDGKNLLFVKGPQPRTLVTTAPPTPLPRLKAKFKGKHTRFIAQLKPDVQKCAILKSTSGLESSGYDVVYCSFGETCCLHLQIKLTCPTSPLLRVFQHATAPYPSKYSSGLGFAALEVNGTNWKHSQRVHFWTVSSSVQRLRNPYNETMRRMQNTVNLYTDIWHQQ